MTYLWQEKIKRATHLLESVSPSFCLAKWLQVTIHLQNGRCHSCHHPNTHKIPLEELKTDPSVLHNTPFKKEQRKKMMEGVRPKECQYCWNIEDSEGDNISDRIIKSSDDWAFLNADKVLKTRWDENISPSYLEVSFGSECNFRCAYCMPDVSSSLFAEFQKHGPYPTSIPQHSLEELKSQERMPYSSNEQNPYVDAFWKWFPNIAQDLEVFRITGGEPLINPNTFKVLDYILENPSSTFKLKLNSNFLVPPSQMELFLKKLKLANEHKSLKSFELYASIDTFGKQAEYIRYGLNYKKFIENIYTYLRRTHFNLTFMATFNILSIPNFNLLLNDILEMKRQFFMAFEDSKEYRNRIVLDISLLSSPEYLSIKIVDDKLLKQMDDILFFMKKNKKTRELSYGFSKYEINKFKRILVWLKHSKGTFVEEEFLRHRQDFYKFIVEYDRRKKVDFLKTFPQMETFYYNCHKT